MPVLLSAWLPLSKPYGIKEQPVRGMPADCTHNALFAIIVFFTLRQLLCCKEVIHLFQTHVSRLGQTNGDVIYFTVAGGQLAIIYSPKAMEIVSD